VEGEEDIETRALRRQQKEIADAEREHAEAAATGEEAEAAKRRAVKAEYLRQKLEERAEAEREAGEPD
jgi:uncharacterized sporulation protein YeaH/YhbH (DUF444 family)